MGINPIKFDGLWDEGFALDVHTLSSVYTGENAYGYPEFNNEYSELGELVHKFKYRGQYNLLKDIIKLIAPFISNWSAIKNVSFVLPVPPSKNRMYQPVQEIALEVSKLIGAGYSSDILQKISSTEAKGLSTEDKNQPAYPLD